MAKETPIVGSPPTKLRVKLFDSTGLVSDRLVEKITEFRTGPTVAHKGPIEIDVALLSGEEVDQLVEYLKKLKGDLPITIAEKKSTPKKIDQMLSEKEPLMDLLKTIKAKATTQEKLIASLREYEFRFVMANIVTDMGSDKKQIILRDKDKDYQYMVRMIKEAKDPANDKYDFRLVFGIKIVGEKVDRVRVYLWGEYSETLTLEWEKKKGNNFKKVEKLHGFPEWMDYEERKKWRKEHRALESAKAKGEPFEESKFYKKHTPYVTIH